MNFSQEGVVLFLHIAVVIATFTIAGILHGALHSLPRAKTVSEMRLFAVLIHRLEPLLPILAIFILGFGSWLIHIEGLKFGDGWILTGLIALIIIEGLAGAVLSPRTKRLVAAIAAAPEGDVPAEVRQAAIDPLIWDIAHIATFGFLGVVFVMADKPTGGVAAVIVVIAVAVGVALSRWQLAMASRG